MFISTSTGTAVFFLSFFLKTQPNHWTKRIPHLCVCLLVCLFVGIKPAKLYSASCVGREVHPLGVITHGQRHKPRADGQHPISHLGPKNLSRTGGPEDRSITYFMTDPIRSPTSGKSRSQCWWAGMYPRANQSPQLISRTNWSGLPELAPLGGGQHSLSVEE